MERLGKKLVRTTASNIGHWCPHCNEVHFFRISRPEGTNYPVWKFDGNIETPTFTPSMRISEPVYGKSTIEKQPDGSYRKVNWKTICHYNLTAGIVKFHGDGPHGRKNVPLQDIPEAWFKGE